MRIGADAELAGAANQISQQNELDRVFPAQFVIFFDLFYF